MNLGFSMGVLSGAQLFAAFLFQVLVIFRTGTGALTDAWAASQAVPLVLYSIIAVAFQGAWQSRLAIVAFRTHEWLSLQRLVLGQLVLVFGCVATLLVFSARYWAGFLFPGFTASQLELTASLSALLVCAAFINGYAAVLMTALRAREQFIPAELAIVGGHVVALVGAFFLIPLMGVLGAGWIVLARSAIVLVVLNQLAGCPLPAPIRALRERAEWAYVRTILAGSSVYKAGPIVDRYWSSFAATGGMTLLTLAISAMGAVATVLERSMVVRYIPRLARTADERRWRDLRALYRGLMVRAASAVFVISVVMSLLYPVWGRIAVSVLDIAKAEAFDLWIICLLLVGYLFSASAGSSIVAVHNAIGDVAVPVVVGVAGFGLSLVLKAVGFHFLGIIGLALATSVHYLGNLWIMYILIDRRIAAREQEC